MRSRVLTANAVNGAATLFVDAPYIRAQLQPQRQHMPSSPDDPTRTTSLSGVRVQVPKDSKIPQNDPPAKQTSSPPGQKARKVSVFRDDVDTQKWRTGLMDKSKEEDSLVFRY